MSEKIERSAEVTGLIEVLSTMIEVAVPYMPAALKKDLGETLAALSSETGSGPHAAAIAGTFRRHFTA